MTERRASTGTPSPGRGGDFDPVAVPVRPAATVLILDERPDLHVLMLKRNARSVFVGDMWVFPGGAVDEDDSGPEAEAVVRGHDDRSASIELGLAQGGLGYWVAALRETFEEAGVVLDGGVEPLDLSDPNEAARYEAHRHALNAGEVGFLDIVRTESLILDAADVHYVSRWVTPVGPPRRYDTRFFVTAMPSGQTPLHDDDEAVHHEWIRPADAVEANRGDEMLMMTPTVAMLRRLARFGTVDAALRAAAAGSAADDEHIRIHYDTEGPDRIAFPGDGGYEVADAEVEMGMVRWPIPGGVSGRH